MATFPSYARLLVAGYSEARESALQRSEFESGPARQARVKSRVMVRRSATVNLESLADYHAFIAWFSTDLDEGAGWFDYTDPVRGTTVQARIVAGDLTATPEPGLQDWTIPVVIETWG